tara:strand:+ start:429 stop:962 length:534 start_codon:yes stop_codon:yes gene_type:complete
MENTYWNNKGKLQKQYDEMYELVPRNGEFIIKDDEKLQTAIENIRQISRLYYDFYNNGCCNVVEVPTTECTQCGGSGYEEEDDEDEYQDLMNCYSCDGEIFVDDEPIIDRYYECMVDNLQFFTSLKIEATLISCGSNYGNYQFPDSDCLLLEKFTDKVIELSWKLYNESHIINTQLV